MRTILPQNTKLSRADSVTVDAERLLQLNSMADINLRDKIGTAFAKLVNSYTKNVLEEQKYTIGQALEVVLSAAEEIRDFTHVESDDEYKPSDPDEDIPVPEPTVQTESVPDKPALTATDRRNMLFKSFSRR